MSRQRIYCPPEKSLSFKTSWQQVELQCVWQRTVISARQYLSVTSPLKKDLSPQSTFSSFSISKLRTPATAILCLPFRRKRKMNNTWQTKISKVTTNFRCSKMHSLTIKEEQKVSTDPTYSPCAWFLSIYFWIQFKMFISFFLILLSGPWPGHC